MSRKIAFAIIVLLTVSALLMAQFSCNNKEDDPTIVPVPGIVAIMDATVCEGQPDTNEGSSTILTAGDQLTVAPAGERRAFLYFNTSSIPTTAIVDSVELHLYVTFCVNTLAAGFTFSLYEADMAWFESVITWTNAPALTLVVQFTGPADGYTSWFKVTEPELIAMVQGWVNTPATNLGIAIAPDFTSADVDGFDCDSREWSCRPNLVVDYHLP